MKARAPDIVGIAERGRNAIARVTPVASRMEGGGWQAVADVRGLFPPNGVVEVQGVFANGLHDGDPVIFRVVAQDRPNAPCAFRAVSPRRLCRFLGNASWETVESDRRILVEIGVETGATGQWAVRIGDDEVVRVTLAQGADGRWRACDPGLASLPVRRFSPELLVSVPDAADWTDQYDFDGSELLDKTVNWSRDDEYLRAAAVACAPGDFAEAGRAIERALKGRIEKLTGRVSLLGGKDAAVLAELVRARFLAERISWEGETLAAFREAIMDDVAVKRFIDEAVAKRLEDERPAFLDAARADLRAEMATERTTFLEETKSLAAQLEASEMDALEKRRADASAEIESSIEQLRATKAQEIDAWESGRRGEAAAEVNELERRSAALKSELEGLANKKSQVTAAIEEGVRREAEVAAQVDRLVSMESKLSVVRGPGSPVKPQLATDTAEAVFELDEVLGRLAKLPVLSKAGVDALARLAVFVTAGEIPIIKGEQSGDLLEFAALVFAGGRIVRLVGNPTLITFEDLWSSPGSSSPTVFGVAVETAAAEGAATVMGAVVRADDSGARFWFPALEDAVRQGALPGSFAACVALDDPASEEGERLCGAPTVIEASGIFVEGAAIGFPGLVSGLRKRPCSLKIGRPVIDPGSVAPVIGALADGLGLMATQRLAAVHAAAVQVFGVENAQAVVAEFARCLGAKTAVAVAVVRDGLTLVGGGNA